MVQVCLARSCDASRGGVSRCAAAPPALRQPSPHHPGYAGAAAIARSADPAATEHSGDGASPAEANPAEIPASGGASTPPPPVERTPMRQSNLERLPLRLRPSGSRLLRAATPPLAHGREARGHRACRECCLRTSPLPRGWPARTRHQGRSCRPGQTLLAPERRQRQPRSRHGWCPGHRVAPLAFLQPAAIRAEACIRGSAGGQPNTDSEPVAWW
jgi:hypothetical protein